MRIIVPANKTVEIKVTFDFIYCKKSNGNFSLRFKDGEFVPFNVNCHKRRQEAVQGFYVENPNDFELDVEMVVGFGDYGDSSTVINQEVKVINAPDIPLVVRIDESTSANIVETSYTLRTIERLNIGSNGSLSFDPKGAKKVRIQNLTGGYLALYSQKGFVMPHLGVEELTLSAAFSVYGSQNGEVVFARFD